MTDKFLMVIGIALVVVIALWFWVRRSTRALEAREEERAAQRRSSRQDAPPASSLSASLNWLIGVGGDVEGKTYHVGNRTATIGRGPGNFVQTTDEDASRIHCQFMPVPGGLQVKDRDSSNGTYVNGQRITVCLLKDGDEIRIGKARLVYRARADFQEDHGLQGKTAGKKASQATKVGDLRPWLVSVLKSSNGDVEAAARELGMNPSELRDMMKRYGVQERGN